MKPFLDWVNEKLASNVEGLPSTKARKKHEELFGPISYEK